MSLSLSLSLVSPHRPFSFIIREKTEAAFLPPAGRNKTATRERQRSTLPRSRKKESMKKVAAALVGVAAQ